MNSNPQLNGSFWAITTYFNPNQYKTKIRNYRQFRKSLINDSLKLICVELAFGNSPYELLDADADILIRVRSNSILWQKERLMNIALESLPKDCDKIVWLDADILFENKNWLQETSECLKHFSVVQPYSKVFYLHKNKITQFFSKNREVPSATYNTVHQVQSYGHPGHAWAAQRKVIDENKFFDQMILGSGDAVMSAAFCKGAFPPKLYDQLPPSLRQNAMEWQKRTDSKIRCEVGYVRGNLLHLYHGLHRNRNYLNRYNLIKGFDPSRDLEKNALGCWEWATASSQNNNLMKSYFWARNEDSSFSREILLFLSRLIQRFKRLKHQFELM